MKRDEYNIIIQTQPGLPYYSDGGDSAFTTGMYAFAGSELDMRLMPHFILDGKLVRHPYSPGKWSDPKETSRDQVLAFYAGLPNYIAKCGRSDRLVKSCLFYAKSWFVNKDLLTPNNKYHLYKCAGVKAPLWLTILAYPNQFLHLLWSVYWKPKHEKNQAIVMNYSFGKKWLKALYKLHPDLITNIRKYFGGWRAKEEIGEALVTRVLKEIY